MKKDECQPYICEIPEEWRHRMNMIRFNYFMAGCAVTATFGLIVIVTMWPTLKGAF